MPPKYCTPPPPLDVETLAPALKAHRRTCIRLHPQRTDTALAPSASKIGGVFLHNDPAHWPRCPEHETHHIAGLQLRREDVPDLPFPEGTSLLQVTWCPHDHDDRYCPEVSLRWLAPGTKLISRPENPAHAEPSDSYVPAECSISPERVPEYPHRWALPPDIADVLETAPALTSLAARLLPNSVDNPLGVYQCLLGSAPGTKLLGHPSWVQDPEPMRCSCGREMEFYLSVASFETERDMKIRWQPRNLPDDDSFDAANVTQLMFGDAGDLYVFVCRHHPTWQTARLMQCS